MTSTYCPTPPNDIPCLPIAVSTSSTLTNIRHPVTTMSRRRLLVTGASTLIGSHILHQLLAYDVSVRAVVGSNEEVQTLRQQYPTSTHPRLEVAIVPHKESAIPGAFEGALRDYPEPFDTIIHTVAADPAEDADCLARLVNMETESSINLLRSIRAVTSRVHRVVVITSLSPFARWLVDPQMEPLSPGGYYNQQRAAEIDSEYVLATSQASDNIIYDALWKWMRDVHAPFDLVYLTAPSVYGPSIRTLENSSDLQEANRRVWNICNSAGERLSSPPYGIDYFTDVRVSQPRNSSHLRSDLTRLLYAGPRIRWSSSCVCPSGKQQAVRYIRWYDALRRSHRGILSYSISRTRQPCSIIWLTSAPSTVWTELAGLCRHTTRRYHPWVGAVPQGRGYIDRPRSTDSRAAQAEGVEIGHTKLKFMYYTNEKRSQHQMWILLSQLVSGSAKLNMSACLPGHRTQRRRRDQLVTTRLYFDTHTLS